MALTLISFGISCASCLFCAALDHSGPDSDGPDSDDVEKLIESFRDDIDRGRIDGDFLSSLEEEFPEPEKDWRILALIYDYRVLTGAWFEEENHDAQGIEFTLKSNLDTVVENLTRLGGDGCEVQLRVGDHHLRRGRYVEAVSQFELTSKAFPESHEAVVGLVQSLWTSGQREKAEDVRLAYIDKFKGDDRDPEVLWYAGMLDSMTGRIEEANRKFIYVDREWRRTDEPRQPSVLVALGDVYRRGRLEGDALDGLKILREALDQNPYVLGAHVSLAKTYLYREETGSASEQVELELLRRPFNPEALSLSASFLIRDHHFQDARDVIEKGLKVNPNSRELLTQLAACDYLSGRGTYRDHVESVLKIDAHYGTVWSELGDAVAGHYRFADAIPLYRLALEVDPETHEARIGLGQCLAHTGQNEEALAILDEAARLDPFRYPWRDNMRKVLKSYLKYPQARKGPFLYLMKSEEEAVLLDVLHETLQASYDELVGLFGFEPDPPIYIEVYKHHPDWSVRTIGFSGFGALGVCFGKVITLVSPGSEMRGRFVWARTARHELTHTFSLLYSNLRVPRWFTEGLSVLEESRGKEHWDRDMQIEFYNAYHSGEVAGILDVDKLFRSSRIVFGYYQSGLMCEFIEKTWGYETLKKMLRLYGDDLETPKVIQEAFGFEASEFDRRFFEWVRAKQIDGIRLIPFYTPAKKDLLRAQWSKDQENPELCEQLAWAYHRLGRGVDRDRFLDLCLRFDPERGGALLLLGERAYDRNQMDQALQYFQDGLENGADDMFVRLKMAEIYAGKEHASSMVEALEAAIDCFPQFVGPGNAYVSLARWYESQGDKDSALLQYEKIVSFDETDMGARQRLVELFQERGDDEQRLRYLKEILDIDPFQRRLHIDLGDLQRQFGHYADAIRSWQVALGVDPSMEPNAMFVPQDEAAESRVRSSIYVRLAEVHLELKDRQKTQEAVDDALKLDPDNEKALALKETLDKGLENF